MVSLKLVKYHLRRYGDPCDNGGIPEVELMELCMDAVTASKARGWYAHSGYLSTSYDTSSVSD